MLKSYVFCRRKAGRLARLCTLPILLLSSIAPANEDMGYQQLRDWVASKPKGLERLTEGVHLTIEDREILESLIPRSAWTYYFFDDMDMEVGPVRHYPAPSGWGEQTGSDVRLDDQGVLSGFAGGGYPFADIADDDPLAAQKVIWNMLWRPGRSDYAMPMVAWLRSENGNLDRTLEFSQVSSSYARGDEALVPGYEEVKGKTITEFRTPRDLAGAKSMSIEYVDHHRENSGWMYIPAQRKPRRTMASERTAESAMGMDTINEDYLGFAGKIYENDWEYLGRRSILTTNNVRDNPEWGGPHLWVPHKARWELREAHVVLIRPRSDDHPYSYRFVFIDAETYWTHWMFAFDRQDDQLLRMSHHFLKYSEDYAVDDVQHAPFETLDYESNLGHNVFLHLGETDINAKKPHATAIHCFVQRRVFSPARAKQFYSLRNMTSGRR